VIVGIIRRKPVLTHASIVCGGMLASVNSVNSKMEVNRPIRQKRTPEASRGGNREGCASPQSTRWQGRLSLSTDGATEPRPILGSTPVLFKNGNLLLKIIYE